jgi:hypothetical protein
VLHLIRIAAPLMAGAFCDCVAAADRGRRLAQTLEQGESGRIGAFPTALRAHARLWRTQNSGVTAKHFRPGVSAAGKLQV